MQPYRCVILRCRPRAHWHARAYNLVTRGELVACRDRNEERRQRFADAFELTRDAGAAVIIRKG
jgi:predicted dehydrogenase